MCDGTRGEPAGDVADALMQGPRGRRLCLAYVAAVDEDVSSALFWLAHARDPHPGTILRIGGGDADADDAPVVTEAELAALIARTAIPSISPRTLREALGETVDHARYWQEPDGRDVVAGLPAVREALASVAVRIAEAMPDSAAPAAAAQWAVDWRDPTDAAPLHPNPSAELAVWTAETHDDERRSAPQRGRPLPSNLSGTWWSVPQNLLASRGSIQDALELVEDSLGWEAATVIPVAGAGRVCEVDSPEDWAALCRTHPMEVTASRRHDWFRVTGRDGRWVIPDWERVAEQWDAVHLTTRGYLSSVTRLIDVDGEYATVIGGWNPDSTIWLTDAARERDEPRQGWTRIHGENAWIRSASTS